MASPIHIHFPRRRQSGAILIVSLLLLLVLTILAVTTMRASTFQERMAGNARDVNLSFQAAEAASRGGEAWLLGLTERPLACGDLAACNMTQEVVDLELLPDLRTAGEAWWEANSVEYGTAGQDIDLVADDPRFVIEELQFVRDNQQIGEAPPDGRMVYRIYSRAEGGTEAAQSVVEATVTRRF